MASRGVAEKRPHRAVEGKEGRGEAGAARAGAASVGNVAAVRVNANGPASFEIRPGSSATAKGL
jgi:hypothetical protein